MESVRETGRDERGSSGQRADVEFSRLGEESSRPHCSPVTGAGAAGTLIGAFSLREHEGPLQGACCSGSVVCCRGLAWTAAGATIK